MSTARISVVIVTYECRELVRECLRALPASLDDVAYQVVAVDNASLDGTAETIRREFPSVRVIESPANVGFARANNLGIAASGGDLILLLNPDTVPLPGSLAGVVRFLDAAPQVGIAAPRLVYPDGRDQKTARAFPTPAAALFGRRSLLRRVFPRNRWSRRYLLADIASTTTPYAVDWVSGAALMVRRAAVAAAGGLDEGFFMHWEDADLCRRVKDAGFQVYAVPSATLIHHEGGSRRGWPPRQIWAFHHGAFRYYRKHALRGFARPLAPLVGAALFARALALIAAGSLPRILRTRAASAR